MSDFGFVALLASLTLNAVTLIALSWALGRRPPRGAVARDGEAERQPGESESKINHQWSMTDSYYPRHEPAPANGADAEDAANARISALEANRDYWQKQCHRCANDNVALSKLRSAAEAERDALKAERDELLARFERLRKRFEPLEWNSQRGIGVTEPQAKRAGPDCYAGQRCPGGELCTGTNRSQAGGECSPGSKSEFWTEPKP